MKNVHSVLSPQSSVLQPLLFHIFKQKAMATITLIFFLLILSIPLLKSQTDLCDPSVIPGSVTACFQNEGTPTICTSAGITVKVRNGTSVTKNIRVHLCYPTTQWTLTSQGNFTQAGSSCNPSNPDVVTKSSVAVQVATNSQQDFTCSLRPVIPISINAPVYYRVEIVGETAGSWIQYGYYASPGSLTVINETQNITDVFTPSEINQFCDFANPNQAFGLNILINGTLVINTNFCVLNPQAINRSHITMNNGSRIIIEPDVSLTMTNTDIENSCDNPQLWESIIVRGGGSFTVTNSTIKNGFRAVSVENNGSFTATNCLFQDNNVSVYTNPSNSPQNIGLGDFRTCVFEGTGNLLLWQGNNIGAYPYAGIEANNVSSANIGVNAFWVPVKFRNMQNGIRANSSNFYIHDCQFENLTDVAIFGSGYGNYLVVGGTSSALLPITNCGVGIQFSNLAYPIIQYTNISNADIGIYATLNNSAFSLLLNNTISARIGIASWLNNLGWNDVKNNYITSNFSNPSVSFGILGLETSWTGSLNIHRNSIEQQAASSGIKFYSGYSTTLNKNQVIMGTGSPYDAVGIGMNGNAFSNITCNEVGGNAYNNLQKSFESNTSSNSLISNNTASTTGIGMHFLGMCTNTDLKTNKFQSLATGLLLAEDAIIGEQPFKGNTWIPNFPYVHGAQHLSMDPGDIAASRFTYESSRSELYPPNVDPFFTWFIDDPNGTSPYYYCSPYLRPNSGSTTTNSRLAANVDRQMQEVQTLALDATESVEGLDWELNKKIMDDQSVFRSAYPNSTKSMARKQLYEKFYKNPDAMRNRGEYQRFVAKMNQGAIGQLNGVKEQLRTAFDYAAADRETMSQNFDNMKAKAKDVATLEEQIDRATDIRERNTLKSRQKALMKEIHEMDKVNDRIAKTNTTARNRKLDASERDNERIRANVLPEINEKTVNAIALKTVARGKAKFDDNQIATLRRIASQCPAEGGDAVFQARSMYAYVSDEQFDDSRLCPQPRTENFALTQRVTSATDVFRVAPNPVSNQLAINCPFKKEVSYKGQVFNTLGTLVKTLNLVEGNNQIDLTDFSEGVYIISIFENDKKVQSQRIIKVKSK